MVGYLEDILRWWRTEYLIWRPNNILIVCKLFSPNWLNKGRTLKNKLTSSSKLDALCFSVWNQSIKLPSPPRREAQIELPFDMVDGEVCL